MATPPNHGCGMLLSTISRVVGLLGLGLSSTSAPDVSGAQATVSAVVVVPQPVFQGLQQVIPAAGFGSVAPTMPSAVSSSMGETSGASTNPTAVPAGAATPASSDSLSAGLEELRAQAADGTLGSGLAAGVMVPDGSAEGQPVSVTVSYN